MDTTRTFHVMNLPILLGGAAIPAKLNTFVCQIGNMNRKFVLPSIVAKLKSAHVVLFTRITSVCWQAKLFNLHILDPFNSPTRKYLEAISQISNLVSRYMKNSLSTSVNKFAQCLLLSQSKLTALMRNLFVFQNYGGETKTSFSFDSLRPQWYASKNWLRFKFRSFRDEF